MKLESQPLRDLGQHPAGSPAYSKALQVQCQPDVHKEQQMRKHCCCHLQRHFHRGPRTPIAAHPSLTSISVCPQRFSRAPRAVRHNSLQQTEMSAELFQMGLSLCGPGPRETMYNKPLCGKLHRFKASFASRGEKASVSLFHMPSPTP